jgi:hypothetical protein
MPFPPTENHRRVAWAVVVRVARELAVLAAAESTLVEPMVESAVRAAVLAASAAAWAAQAERGRVAAAQVVPWTEDRALTPAW